MAGKARPPERCSDSERAVRPRLGARVWRGDRATSHDASQQQVHITSVDLATIPPERVRNFSIVAHIDHGKSTLADRILEHTGAIPKSSSNKQVLDKLPVERERGITVKAQTASVLYRREGELYLLNLIDTPGHVDFSSEVSRSLLACQGVILLVDANQGVQAQTVSNFYLSFSNDLEIVPVLNKVDLPQAQPDIVKQQLNTLFEIDPSSVVLASAKTGLGIDDVLRAVIERIPPPSEKWKFQDPEARFLLQDSWYDQFKGTVNLVQVVSGCLRVGDNITSVKTGKTYNVKTLGILTPLEHPVSIVHTGQVGFFTCGMKSAQEALAGDTFHLKDKPVQALVEIKPPRPMVFAGFYPFDAKEHSKLRSAIEKLCLNDPSVSVAVESSAALGHGWRLGFLGVLHMEVFSQRLEQEWSSEVIVTTPSVPFKVQLRQTSIKKLGGNSELIICNPVHWPEACDVEMYLEPVVRGTILAPREYFQDIVTLCTSCRGKQEAVDYVDEMRIKLEFILPLNEIVNTFFDDLKTISSGYASFDYDDAGYVESKLVRVDVLLNSRMVEELSVICHATKARQIGKAIVARLRDTLPRQQFQIALQAAVGANIIARDNIQAIRKDVTAKCYGGDLTRKMKLLRHQAEGKKRMKSIGNIEISKENFVDLLKK